VIRHERPTGWQIRMNDKNSRVPHSSARNVHLERE
jgi:hypothetical protein